MSAANEASTTERPSRLLEATNSDAGIVTWGRKMALIDVSDERDRQDDKWGPQTHHPIEWLSILSEEVGEAAQAANQCNWHPEPRWFHQLRAELVQVAAVAVAAIEQLDREAEARP